MFRANLNLIDISMYVHIFRTCRSYYSVIPIAAYNYCYQAIRSNVMHVPEEQS